MGAFQNDSIDAIEVLMEFGARLDIADTDGHTPEGHFIRCGPKVTAVLQKWKRKRAGVANPLDVKACAMCAKADGPLKFCAKCHATWHCSKECQKRDWSAHKPLCGASGSAAIITVKPFYSDEYNALMPVVELTRRQLGHPAQELPSRSTRAVQKPRISPGQTKQMIIKVQVPLTVPADAPPEMYVEDLIVYDKKRTFVCRVRKEDGVDGYMQISHAVRTKGVGRAKAYFSAEMMSPDALVVKVSEVLAEQTFSSYIYPRRLDSL